MNGTVQPSRVIAVPVDVFILLLPVSQIWTETDMQYNYSLSMRSTRVFTEPKKVYTQSQKQLPHFIKGKLYTNTL